MDIYRIINSNMINILQTISGTELAGKYYLAGGTGLALQLRHRISDDLDFFCYKDDVINNNTIIDIIEELFKSQRLSIDIKKEEQLDMRINSTKVSFISYPFKPLFPLIKGSSLYAELKGVFVASVKEIALMKAYTMGRRNTFKDYLDIYFILKSRKDIDLSGIIRETGQKYHLEEEKLFSEKLFIEQLTYTADIKDKEESISKLLYDNKLSVDDIERFLKLKVSDYINETTIKPNYHKDEGYNL